MQYQSSVLIEKVFGVWKASSGSPTGMYQEQVGWGSRLERPWIIQCQYLTNVQLGHISPATSDRIHQQRPQIFGHTNHYTNYWSWHWSKLRVHLHNENPLHVEAGPQPTSPLLLRHLAPNWQRSWTNPDRPQLLLTHAGNCDAHQFLCPGGIFCHKILCQQQLRNLCLGHIFCRVIFVPTIGQDNLCQGHIFCHKILCQQQLRTTCAQAVYSATKYCANNS